jgi:hypothetical protein
VAGAGKLLERMRTNPRDWRIDDLKAVARKYSIEFRQHGTSHVVFRHPRSGMLTVPSARPIKPVYIRQFVQLIDRGESVE